MNLGMRSLVEDQNEQRLDDLHDLKDQSEKVENQQEKNARDVSINYSTQLLFDVQIATLLETNKALLAQRHLANPYNDIAGS